MKYQMMYLQKSKESQTHGSVILANHYRSYKNNQNVSRALFLMKKPEEM